MVFGKYAVVALAVLIVVLAGAVIVRKSHRFSVPQVPQYMQLQGNSTESAALEGSASSSPILHETVVDITKDGFSPSTVTVKAGESVSWTNADTGRHAVDSDPHPTNTDYPPLNIGSVEPGDKKSLVFPEPGSYKYHDFDNPQFKGVVIVQ